MASPEAIAIQKAEARERQSIAMEALVARLERIESKLDEVLTSPSTDAAKTQTKAK
jgi:hypothetical protein